MAGENCVEGTDHEISCSINVLSMKTSGVVLVNIHSKLAEGKLRCASEEEIRPAGTFRNHSSFGSRLER